MHHWLLTDRGFHSVVLIMGRINSPEVENIIIGVAIMNACIAHNRITERDKHTDWKMLFPMNLTQLGDNISRHHKRTALITLNDIIQAPIRGYNATSTDIDNLCKVIRGVSPLKNQFNEQVFMQNTLIAVLKHKSAVDSVLEGLKWVSDMDTGYRNHIYNMLYLLKHNSEALRHFKTVSQDHDDWLIRMFWKYLATPTKLNGFDNEERRYRLAEIVQSYDIEAEKDDTTSYFKKSVYKFKHGLKWINNILFS